MGGADIADRQPDERRAFPESNPRLHARHHRRRDLWRCHRGADPAFRRRQSAGAVGAGGDAARLHRRHQSEPQFGDGDGRDRAAGSDHAPRRQPAQLGVRSGSRSHRRRAHGTAGVVPGAAVAGGQPDPRQCGGVTRTARRGLRRIAGRADARPRQRCPAPDSGRHRHRGDRTAGDRRRGRAWSARRSVDRPRHRSVAAHHPAAAPRCRDDRPRQRACRCPRNVQTRLARPLAEVSKAIVDFMRAVAASLRNSGGHVDIQPGRRRATRLCGGSRRRAKRRPDPWPARRRGGTVLRAWLLAGTDAPKSQRPRPLPWRLVRRRGRQTGG